jgi:hypothetical protein
MCLINSALCHEHIWGTEDIAPQFLNLALDGGYWSAPHSTILEFL